MDTEHRFILILALLCTMFLSILALVLFIALWEYRVILGWVFISLVLLMFLLLAGVIINEQILRHRRVKYHTEIPVQANGTPFIIPQNMKPYQEGARDA